MCIVCRFQVLPYALKSERDVLLFTEHGDIGTNASCVTLSQSLGSPALMTVDVIEVHASCIKRTEYSVRGTESP